MKTPIKDKKNNFKCYSVLKELIPKGTIVETYNFFAGELELRLTSEDRFVIANTEKLVVYEFWKSISEKPDVVDSIVTKVNDALRNSQDVTVFTSREVVTGSSPEDYLRIGAKVTDAMTEIVKFIDITPRYIISKGGMTSSNVTTNGLGMVRAIVPGQIQPGVLVLRLGEETKFPGTHLVLYPGNVGGPESIADVVRKLS